MRALTAITGSMPSSRRQTVETPTVVEMDWATAVDAVAGPEQPYPSYEFSNGRKFYN